MIATQKGNTKLAIFEGPPEGSRKGVGFHLVAFRIGSAAFVEFVARLPEFTLLDDRGRRVGQEMVSDHGSAYSVYFCDPFGNYLEITTYDYDKTAAELRRLREAKSK
jgi:hypothetical protein